MQFAHAGDHRFLGLHVEIAVECRVLFDELMERAGELRLVGTALGRDGQPDHRRGELDRGHHQLSERHAGLKVFELGDCHDRSGRRLVGRRGLVRLNTEQLGDFQPFTNAGGRHNGVALQGAGEDADEIQLLHEGVDAGFENLGDERAGRVGLQLHRLAGGVLGRPLWTPGRQGAHHQRIEQLGEPRARLARHADDRNQAPVGHCLHKQRGELLLGGHVAFEVRFHHGFVGHHDRLDQRTVDFR